MGLAKAGSDVLGGRLSSLYQQARVASSWNPARDFNWTSRPSLSPHGEELVWFLASAHSYAEQTGLVIASRLLAETEDLSARLALATAVSDEAKHSEAFARYAIYVGGSVQPMDDESIRLFSTLDRIPSPLGRFLVHTILEGLAHDEFILFEKAFTDDILRRIYHNVRRDEARHVAMGLDYLARVHRDRAGGLETAEFEEYEHIGFDLANLDKGAFAFMSNITGHDPDLLNQWFLRRHRARMNFANPRYREHATYGDASHAVLLPDKRPQSAKEEVIE